MGWWQGDGEKYEKKKNQYEMRRRSEGWKRGIRDFFFFKQKTTYEIRLSLVGSGMCIRDRTPNDRAGKKKKTKVGNPRVQQVGGCPV